MHRGGTNVIEERQAGSTGAWRQEMWGLGYVNSLIEQDTATAVDSGGVLPTSHFLQYALDTSFNGTGVNVTSTSGSYDSVAIQGNGQIVVAGVTGSNLTITRYNPNGSLDAGFGTTGVVTLSETSPTFCKLAIDASGNIVVAVNSGSAVQVSRLSGVDGSLDTSFNSTGQMTLTFATSVVPQGLAIGSSGKIVVAGDSSSGTGIYLARVTTSGAPDTTFGSSGYVNAPLSGAPSGLSLAFDASGNILIAGSDGGDFSVVRLTSSGSLDTTFNTTGEVKVNMGGTDTAYAVAPGPAGMIVAAGVSVQGGSNYDALIRLTSAGALDTTFNSTGKILGSSGSGTIRAILVQTNGEILAGGDASSGTAQKVWMFTPAGAADTAFATGGTLTANSGATVFGWAVASGATQRIVVAGSYGGYAALAAFAPASLRLYAQHDSNYNVTAMADSNANVVQRYVYDPYGNMTVLSATWTPQSDLFNTQVGFQDMWLDAASGLYHTPNRDLNPATGTWEEQDPAGYINGSDRYAFEGDNATTFVDPSGTVIVANCDVPAYLDQNGVKGYSMTEVAGGNDSWRYSGNATQYRDGDVDSEILARMIEANEVFTVTKGTVANLELQVLARHDVIDFATAKKYPFNVNEKLNSSFWHFGNNNGVLVPMINDGVSPFAALNDINSTPGDYALACHDASELAMAAGIANAMGQAAFDKRPNGPLFSSDTVDDSGKRKVFIPGDWGFIENTGKGAHNPGAEGENIIYVGGGQYWGHLGGGPMDRSLNTWLRDVKDWNGGSKLTPQRIRPKAGLDN